MILAIGLPLLAGCATADDTSYIDVHMHFQMAPERSPAASALSAVRHMEQAGIARSLLMPPPYVDTGQRNFYDSDEMAFVLRDHPGKFALLGGSRLNALIHRTAPEAVDDALRARFRTLAEDTLRPGVVGFGEIAIHHLSLPAMGQQHAYEHITALHPLLQLLAEIAAEKDVPIDLHFDLVPVAMPLPDLLRTNPQNPATLSENLGEFKTFLARNPHTRIIWSHVGFEPLLTRQPELVEALLREFPNLYMSFRLNRRAPNPAAAIGPDGRLKPGWLKLIETYPDRFMLGSDAFYDRSGIARGSNKDGFDNLRSLLAALSEPARAAVAYKNAQRLFKLQ